jgi:hypothetical protein
MTDLGKLLILLGLTMVVAGVLIQRDRTCEPSFREVAKRFCWSTEKHNALFSPGDFGAGERGALGRIVPGGPVEEVESNLLIENRMFSPTLVQLTSERSSR